MQEILKLFFKLKLLLFSYFGQQTGLFKFSIFFSVIKLGKYLEIKKIKIVQGRFSKTER